MRYPRPENNSTHYFTTKNEFSKNETFSINKTELPKMTDGYIYCFSNPSMPGILKIGMTERTPEARLSEANASDTWRPPTSYKIEFAKKVSNPFQKEKTLHTLLEQYTDRIHARREFFRVSPEEVRKFFDLMDGEMWAEIAKDEDEDKEEEEEEETEEEGEATENNIISSSKLEKQARTKNKGCRDMAKCFTNGQRIRHTIGINNIWVATFNLMKKCLIHNGKEYKTMCSFANAHWKNVRPDSIRHADGWGGCQCEVDGEWISTYSLPG
jgi:hypothetical protein